jgi:hypothetical protein
MARILKRPMFNRGGSTNNGIMTGLVDRKGYAEGPTQAEIYAKEYEDMLSKIDPPKAKLPLGQIGLNLISGQYACDGLLQNIAGSAKDPYASFVKQDDALRNLGYQKRMTAAKMGISRAEAERLAKIKAAGTSSMQKDYTPQRAYETQVAANIESAGKLKSFEKPDINQKYPRATAEYDTYILRNLRSTTNETGQLIAANNMGFVPFDPKTQTFDYGSMRPGAFYYDPRIRSFVQRMPASDDDEGGIFIYDKNTFKKRKFEK